jgi:putative transposase
MPNGLERRYGSGHLHFITCSCYRRMPSLGTPEARDRFLRILNEVRDRYDFGLHGYVVMPEHIHLLMTEPNFGNPSMVMKALKLRVSRALRRKKKRKNAAGQMRLWEEVPLKRYAHFWQRRFYDFNVWSNRKKNEKLNYIHFNPVKRGLVEKPQDWKWSSAAFYLFRAEGLCPPNPNWAWNKRGGTNRARAAEVRDETESLCTSKPKGCKAGL